MEIDEFQGQAITADHADYGTAVYDRLVDMKTKYDPDNVFHHNQNIRPRSE